MKNLFQSALLFIVWLSTAYAPPTDQVASAVSSSDATTIAPGADAAETRGYPGQAVPVPYPLPLPNPALGGVSAFGASGSAYHGPPDSPMAILGTDIDCQKTYMNVYFKFSRPFTGYIYPYGYFSKCVLWVGRGESEVRLKLYQDICGAEPPAARPGYSQRTDPLIEHRLMVQWDTDLVQEYDTNVLLRCDRPDDYNRTIKFDLTSVVGENRQTLVKTHPGPKLWMEIQDGEGPTASPLVGPVYLGQTLSLVFTLGDEIFNFDSNVMHCWATDGQTSQPLVPIFDPNQGNVPQRPLLTNLQVIEAACSVKPKLFGNFQKSRDTYSGVKTTTQWVLFKAFRFPTTSRVVIQCDIQVCFEKCYPLKPCDIPYEGRSSSRKRRAADSQPANNSSIVPEMLSMFRSIEVQLPKETETPMAIINGSVSGGLMLNMGKGDCLSSSTFYGVILGLGIVLLIIIVVVAVYVTRQNKKNRSKT